MRARRSSDTNAPTKSATGEAGRILAVNPDLDETVLPVYGQRSSNGRAFRSNGVCPAGAGVHKKMP